MSPCFSYVNARLGQDIKPMMQTQTKQIEKRQAVYCRHKHRVGTKVSEKKSVWQRSKALNKCVRQEAKELTKMSIKNYEQTKKSVRKELSSNRKSLKGYLRTNRKCPEN